MAKTPYIDLRDNSYSRNYIINGGFDFWQRGTSLAISSSGYLADRWNNYESDGALTVSRQSFTAGQTDVPNNPSYYHRSQMTSGSSTKGYVQQRIEDVNTLSGKTATLSFYAKADSAINIEIWAIQSFGTGGSATVNTVVATKTMSTSWTKYTVTMNIPSVAGKTIVAGAGNYLNISLFFPTGTTFIFDITNVMLNEGTEAVDFKLAGNTLAGELQLCQRYFEKSYPINDAPGTSYGDASTAIRNHADGACNYFSIPVHFKATKRAIPTCNVYNVITGSVSQMRVDAANISAVAGSPTIYGMVGYINNSAIPVNSFGYLHFTADSEL